MRSKTIVFQQAGIIVPGQILCTAVMFGVFAILGRLSPSVVLGGITGAFIATANFFLMSLSVCRAADMAESQNAAGGQRLIQLSYMGRMLGLFLILLLCAKSGLCNLFALILPLVFTRPILTLAEIFKKKGDAAA